MNITTFSTLKQHHIIVWRVVVLLILTFWEVPKQLLHYLLLNFPIAVIYHICLGIRDIINDLTESIYNAIDLFVRYFQLCKHLIHETAEEGADDGK